MPEPKPEPKPEPQEKVLLYPPIAVTRLPGYTNYNKEFRGKVSGQQYGNGTYTISIDKTVPSNGLRLRKLDLLYDKEVGAGDPYRILHKVKDMVMTFTFPDNVIIKEMFTHNNHSCKNCDITINDILVYSGSIDIAPNSYASINLFNNTKISKSVIVGLYNGTKTYIQNSEFYFNVIIPRSEPEERNFNFVEEKKLFITDYPSNKIVFFRDSNDYRVGLYETVNSVIKGLVNDETVIGQEIQNNWYLVIKVDNKYTKFDLKFEGGSGGYIMFSTSPVFTPNQNLSDDYSVKFYTKRKLPKSDQ